MAKKMTAVQWLEIAVQNKLASDMGPYFAEAFEQAKEMEKQQIMDAYREGRTDQQTRVPKYYNRSSAIYYTSTFNL
jgi:hypothetical protein